MATNPKWIKLKQLMAPVDKKLFAGEIGLMDYLELEDVMIELAGFKDDKEYVDEIDKHWDDEEDIVVEEPKLNNQKN